jgi:glycolate oxidase
MTDDRAFAQLRAAVPDLEIVVEPAEIEVYRWDATALAHPGTPVAVARPTSTQQVRALVAFAAERRIAIVPRGAGTGLSGGALGVDGAITLSLERMDHILEVNADDLYAVVQPGVINADLGRAAARRGLFYPPDPASYETCTLGGNIAENAGGLRCVKYGVTTDYVLGLEVVLADGTVIRTGGRVVKDVMGYDLTRLFVGSEGTLGIVTEATLRLRPAPAARSTFMASFADVIAAGEAVARITRSGIVPLTLELMDRRTMRSVESALNLGLDGSAGAVLLVESDAPGTAAEAEIDAAVAACLSAGATGIDRARDEHEADRLRDARRRAYWALEQEGTARMEDVGVPRSRAPELLRAIERRAAEHQVDIAIYGHAGDGNYHPTFVLDPGDLDAAARVDRVRRDIYADVLALGGTVTGEHGIGTVKREQLLAQRGSRQVELMRSLKDALDPQGILNPGKVLPDRP